MGNKNADDLLTFVSSLGGGDGLRVEETLGSGYVRLRVAEAERRQAKHDIRCVEDAVIELLRNARDAGASNIFVAFWKESDVRSILVLDDGMGIPPNMHERVFDARVTSKLDSLHVDRWGVHGRGMALYSIAQNAREAHVVDSNVGLGSAILATFDVRKVRERADQSTWPSIKGAGEHRTVLGPKNIARTCVEFALEARGTCAVYLGSPAEVLSTMHCRVPTVGTCPSSFSEQGLASIPVTMRAAWAQDARQMCTVAESLGIEISQRNAHRVIRGDIAPLRQVLYVVEGSGLGGHDTRSDHHTHARRILLSEEDQREFELALEQAFSHVAARYYVVLDEPPKVRVDKDAVRVAFHYREDD